jgi:site-specific DNA-methyltransferase (adenine-specific)/adenine-specific DNA-methyltransferase
MPVLDWIGKKAVVNHHREVAYRLVHCDRPNSAGDPDAGNLLVQGDNLEALKALLPYYAGKVKCIYIDPPYNTGNEGWIYNDNVNSPEIRAWLGKTVGREIEDLSRHDKWLCMMYPRLRILREFLHPEGALYVSIDDGEHASLRMLLDEIFGRNHFVGTIIWQKRTSRENRAVLSVSHDFILIYSACKAENYKRYRNKLSPNDKGFSNIDGDLKGPWRSIPFSAQGYRENQMDTSKNPASGRVLTAKVLGCDAAV